MTQSAPKSETRGRAGGPNAAAGEKTWAGCGKGRETAIATAATIAVVAGGAVVFEAALIPGIVLGLAAALGPSVAPRIGTDLFPLVRAGLRETYRFGRKSGAALAQAEQHLRAAAAEGSAAAKSRWGIKPAAYSTGENSL